MIRCDFPAAVLVGYLKKRIINPEEKMPTKLADHAKSCQTCARLLKEETLASSFLRFFDAIEKSSSPEKLKCAPPAAIKAGQIWRFFYGPEKETEFCLITSEPFKGESNLDLAVRIAPIFCCPRNAEIHSSDMVLTSDANPLEIPLMIETWNERPILTRQLMQYQGCLTPEQLDVINQMLEAPEATNEINATIAAFRQSEINRGMLFSEEVFTQLTELEKLYADEPQEHSGIVNIVYRKLKTIIKNCFIELEHQLIRPPQHRVCAASEKKPGEKTEVVYTILRKALEAHKDLPFRLRKNYDGSLNISHLNKKEFTLNLCEKENTLFTARSEKATCIILPESLPDFFDSQITGITFEE